KSATTSKYFSMNSPRPWKTQTVPRRGGRVGSQRAKRSWIPREDLKTPVVAPLGTGFLASATSSMRASLPHVAAEQSGSIRSDPAELGRFRSVLKQPAQIRDRDHPAPAPCERRQPKNEGDPGASRG